MVTNRYDFKFSEEEGIEAELIAGRAKVFEFNVILAKKMEVFDEYIKSQKNN